MGVSAAEFARLLNPDICVMRWATHPRPPLVEGDRGHSRCRGRDCNSTATMPDLARSRDGISAASIYRSQKTAPTSAPHRHTRRRTMKKNPTLSGRRIAWRTLRYRSPSGATTRPTSATGANGASPTPPGKSLKKRHAKRGDLRHLHPLYRNTRAGPYSESEISESRRDEI